MAVTIDTDDEVSYLRDLSGALGLDDQTVSQVHQELGVEF